jgi:hypothetical protein
MLVVSLNILELPIKGKPVEGLIIKKSCLWRLVIIILIKILRIVRLFLEASLKKVSRPKE